MSKYQFVGALFSFPNKELVSKNTKNLVYKNGSDEKPSTRNTRQQAKAQEHKSLKNIKIRTRLKIN
jgi:hypothetical protein